MNEDLQGRIIGFFDYWKQRHEFIRVLDFNKNKHEANVLIWASLDALSNLWAKHIGRKQCGNKSKSKRLIFDAFLACYGGKVFQVVSLPDVWIRIDREDVWTDRHRKEQLPENICKLLGKIGNRQTSTLIEERRTRQITDDWSLDSIIDATLTECPQVNQIKLEEWLRFSRYGAIAYNEMRSAYIHEGRSGKRTHGLELYGSTVRPTYLSKIYATPPRMDFKAEYMLSVLGLCHRFGHLWPFAV